MWSAKVMTALFKVKKSAQSDLGLHFSTADTSIASISKEVNSKDPDEPSFFIQFATREKCPCDRGEYSRLSLSRSPRDFVKYFEIAVPRHIRFAELRKK